MSLCRFFLPHYTGWNMVSKMVRWKADSCAQFPDARWRLRGGEVMLVVVDWRDVVLRLGGGGGGCRGNVEELPFLLPPQLSVLG